MTSTFNGGMMSLETTAYGGRRAIKCYIICGQKWRDATSRLLTFPESCEKQIEAYETRSKENEISH